MNDWKEALQWYRTHQTTSEVGFNPDGMCLKICRTARAIGSKYASAKEAQDATPAQHRVHNIRDLRRGMVIFFDDPNDSNKFGHITTMIGRVKGYNPDSLHEILVETNSVVSGQIVVVRGDYFQQHWGDSFQFGATMLNGVVLDVPNLLTRVQNFKRSGPNYNVRILDRAIKDGRRDVQRHRDAIDRAVEDLPNDKRNTRVKAFKDYYAKNRVLKMPLLEEAVGNKRTGKVRNVRDRLRLAIKSLPDS